MDLRIITPAMVLNYTDFLLKDCHLFEQAFRVFERSLELFGWPHKYHIWLKYLQVAANRFRDTKVERVRELYNKCLNSLPEYKESTKGQIPE